MEIERLGANNSNGIRRLNDISAAGSEPFVKSNPLRALLGDRRAIDGFWFTVGLLLPALLRTWWGG